jgi:hypothetical protein
LGHYSSPIGQLLAGRATWIRLLRYVVSSLNTIAHIIASPGCIFKAYNVYDGTFVALKVQDINHECPTNRYEQAIYPLLQGGEGMPTLWANGVHGNWHYLVISLLGRSLDSIYRQRLQSGHKVMDLRSVCSIAIQVVSFLVKLHFYTRTLTSIHQMCRSHACRPCTIVKCCIAMYNSGTVLLD